MWHYWERLVRAQEARAEAADRLAETHEELLALGRDWLMWFKRAALAALLWGSGAGLTLKSEQLADIAVAVLKGGLR